MAVAALVVAVVATPATAVDDDRVPLRDGGWVGSFSAAGPVTTSFPEGSAVMVTAMTGTTDFVVIDDTVVGGAWTISGSSSGTMTSTMGVAEVANVYTGAGPVSGDATGLTLGGGLSTIWEMRLGDQVFVDEDPVRLGPFDVDIVHADCVRMIGTWESSFAAAVADAGDWDAMLGGVFEAAYGGDDPDAALAAEVEQLLADGDELLGDVIAGTTVDADGQLTVAGDVHARLQVLSSRAIALEQQLAEAQADHDCPFDAVKAETFSNLVTGVVQDVAFVLLLHDGAIHPFELEWIIEQLLAVGGLGPASAHPGRAAQLEGLLTSRLGARLADVAVTDGAAVDGRACTSDLPCLPMEADTIHLLRAAQLLGAPVTIGEASVTPDEAAALLTVVAS